MINLSQYHRVRLGGQHLITVNSGDIHWLTEGKDNSFPLLPSPDLDTESLTLLLEVKNGYFCYPQGAEANWEQVGEFERFSCQFLGFHVAQPS